MRRSRRSPRAILRATAERRGSWRRAGRLQLRQRRAGPRCDSRMLAAGATDHVAESKIQSVSARSSPSSTFSGPLSRTRSLRASASAASHSRGKVAQPQAPGKNPPCAPASPTTGANAVSAAATPSGRLRASPRSAERLGPTTSSVTVSPSAACLSEDARPVLCSLGVRCS